MIVEKKKKKKKQKKKKRKEKKKRTSRILNFAVPEDHEIKLKESEKRDKYLDLTRKKKKKNSKQNKNKQKHPPPNEETLEQKWDGITNCNWCTWNNRQRIGKGTGT